MELLKSWTACVSITIIIAVIFSIFVPKGKMASFYKMIISLFVFLSFLYPLKSINIPKLENSINSNSVVEGESRIMENTINSQIKSKLIEKGIENCSVSSIVTKINDEFKIEKVTIGITSESNNDEVKKLIFDELGINAEVHSIGN